MAETDKLERCKRAVTEKKCCACMCPGGNSKRECTQSSIRMSYSGFVSLLEVAAFHAEWNADISSNAASRLFTHSFCKHAHYIVCYMYCHRTQGLGGSIEGKRSNAFYRSGFINPKCLQLPFAREVNLQ